MARLTIGALRRAIADLPDDAIVVIDNESHRYSLAGDALAATALFDGANWHEDLWADDADAEVGAQTEFGSRVRVLKIDASTGE
jgi:hypothetical protein